jgi:hypothetical protein
MAKTFAPRTVQCYHCRRRFEAGSAMILPCPGCHKNVNLEDVVVKTLKSVVTLQTCGRVKVEPKGRIKADLVEAHQGVEVLGSLEANVVSGGPVRIGPKALWKGDCRAPSLKLELGATVRGGYFVIPDHSLGVGDLLARN